MEHNHPDKDILPILKHLTELKDAPPSKRQRIDEYKLCVAVPRTEKEPSDKGVDTKTLSSGNHVSTAGSNQAGT